jgi:hypothetical protein
MHSIAAKNFTNGWGDAFPLSCRCMIGGQHTPSPRAVSLPGFLSKESRVSSFPVRRLVCTLLNQTFNIISVEKGGSRRAVGCALEKGFNTNGKKIQS